MKKIIIDYKCNKCKAVNVHTIKKPFLTLMDLELDIKCECDTQTKNLKLMDVSLK